MNDHPASAENAMGWFDSLLRHRGKAAVMFLALMTLVVAATARSARYYESEAALYFRLGRENATVDPTTSVGSASPIFSPGSREREINSIVEILGSRGMAETVVDRLGPEKLLGDDANQNDASLLTQLGVKPQLGVREKAVLRFMKRFSAEANEDANVVWLRFEAKEAESAQKIVGAVIDCYLAKHLEFHRSAGSRRFLEEQTEQAKVRLRELEAQLSEARDDTQLVSLEDQRRAAVNQAATLELNLLEQESLAASLTKRVESLRGMLEATPATLVTSTVNGISNDAADRMRDRLYSAQLLEQDLLTRFTANHPAVVNARKQIAESSSILKRENSPRTQITQALSRTHEAGQIALMDLEPQLLAADARAATLGEQLEKAQQRLLAINRDEMQLVQLSRDVALADAEYRRYATGLNQARLDEALEMDRISNANIVQKPTLSSSPVRPNWTLNLAGGLLLSLIGCYGFTGLLDARRSSWNAREESSPNGEIAPLPRPSTT